MAVDTDFQSDISVGWSTANLSETLSYLHTVEGAGSECPCCGSGSGSGSEPPGGYITTDCCVNTPLIMYGTFTGLGAWNGTTILLHYQGYFIAATNYHLWLGSGGGDPCAGGGDSDGAQAYLRCYDGGAWETGAANNGGVNQLFPSGFSNTPDTADCSPFDIVFSTGFNLAGNPAFSGTCTPNDPGGIEFTA